MPVIDVTYDDTLDEPLLRRLGGFLADVVAEAVDCPEEPWTGPPDSGDIEIRFHRKGDLDVGGLNVVVEVRTRRFDSRVGDEQRRADLILDSLSSLRLGKIGVWLVLAEGAWTQS